MGDMNKFTSFLDGGKIASGEQHTSQYSIAHNFPLYQRGQGQCLKNSFLTFDAVKQF